MQNKTLTTGIKGNCMMLSNADHCPILAFLKRLYLLRGKLVLHVSNTCKPKQHPFIVQWLMKYEIIMLLMPQRYDNFSLKTQIIQILPSNTSHKTTATFWKNDMKRHFWSKSKKNSKCAKPDSIIIQNICKTLFSVIYAQKHIQFYDMIWMKQHTFYASCSMTPCNVITKVLPSW